MNTNPKASHKKKEHKGKAPRTHNQGHVRQKLTHGSQRYQFGGGDRRSRRQKKIVQKITICERFESSAQCILKARNLSVIKVKYVFQ